MIESADVGSGEAAARALARLRIEMTRPPFHAFLEPQPIAVEPDTGVVTVAMAWRPHFRRSPEGEEWHGGAIAALIDLTAHAAVAVRLESMAPTIDLRIDYLRPATGDLIAKGKLLRFGRTVARADVDVLDRRGRRVAVGRGSFSTAAQRP